MSKLFLIDAYAIIYRSYYALMKSPRINSKGLNTNAIIGFCYTLREILQKQKPTHIAVAFDHGKTFRHDVFPEYKAQREETPEDIRLAIPIIKDILKALNIPILQVDGFEADDIIGTVAKNAESDGMDVFMLTPDKDYAQLVTNKIHIFRPRHGGGYEDMGPSEVNAKYGIESTSQVIDLLGLMGDSSDNYQGCPGVGEKTAVKLILQFGSIEKMLENTDKIKGKLREKVEASADDIRLSKFLATIRQDVPIDISLDEMRLKKFNEPKLEEIFEELEFKAFAQKFLGHRLRQDKSEDVKKSSEVQTNVNKQLSLFEEFATEDPEDFKNPILTSPNKTVSNIKVIENETDMEYFCGLMAHNRKFAFSVEGSSKNGIEAKLRSISFATDKDTVYQLVMTSFEGDNEWKKNKLQMIFSDSSCEKIVQNAKYAIQVLYNSGITIKGNLWDTMVAHYLKNPDLHHNREYYESMFHVEQPATLLATKGDLEAELEKNGMLKLFEEVEMPLIPVLAEMELNGVRIDTNALKEAEKDLSVRLQQAEMDIYTLAGEQFNISSPKQVGDILFGKLHLMEKPKKTKTGQYVTNEEILNSLKTKNPIVEKILSYRAMKKLLSTYIEVLPTLINPRTGHIHTTFNQCITATGRLSSSDPNLQNIPVRTEDGKEIRKCFIPEPGEELFSCDYSQVELRIMASLSGDKHMIAAFNQGQDIHAATSAKIFHKPIEEVTKLERRKAKSANFGIIYGITAFGLAQDLGIDRKEAKALIDGYFENFPRVMDFIEECKQKVRETGYAVTIMGRRRYLPDINSNNGTVRAFAERNAVNAPIQGSAADIMKLAMVHVYQRLKRENLKAKMLLQVHDELIFSVPTEEKGRVGAIVKEEMENACHLAVPLLAEGGWGKNWLEAH